MLLQHVFKDEGVPLHSGVLWTDSERGRLRRHETPRPDGTQGRAPRWQHFLNRSNVGNRPNARTPLSERGDANAELDRPFRLRTRDAGPDPCGGDADAAALIEFVCPTIRHGAELERWSGEHARCLPDRKPPRHRPRRHETQKERQRGECRHATPAADCSTHASHVIIVHRRSVAVKGIRPHWSGVASALFSRRPQGGALVDHCGVIVPRTSDTRGGAVLCPGLSRTLGVCGGDGAWAH